MGEQYVGEIRVFAGNYAPRGWLSCDGATLQIPMYQALFAVIGVQYGGDGVRTFQLPDLRARVAMGMGAGPNLTARVMGRSGGEASVTLLASEMPNHTHTPNCQSLTNQTTPAGAVWASTPPRSGAKMYADAVDTPMSPLAASPSGGDQPHNNLQPYLALNFIIAVEGVFPVRS
jgi:microcystin-dependent protein